MEYSPMQLPLVVNFLFSGVACLVLFNIIPKFKDMFLAAGLSGVDMNKTEGGTGNHPKGKPVL